MCSLCCHADKNAGRHTEYSATTANYVGRHTEYSATAANYVGRHTEYSATAANYSFSVTDIGVVTDCWQAY